jgi:uncharacterized protein (TIGR02147 family)
VSNTPKLYAYTNYREYLRDYLATYREDDRKSVRGFARTCGISSPNYFQQVISGKRNLTAHFARKFAKGAKLGVLETEYLLAMVDLDTAEEGKRRQAALTTMRQVVQRSLRRKIRDEGMHSSWTNAVLWELSKTKRFRRDAESLVRILRNSVSADQVENALKFLLDRGFIKGGDPDRPLTPMPIDFEPSNDVRRIDLQRSHLQFLRLAQHRLNDPLSEREFQGLTVAIDAKDFETIRQRCRDFIADLNDRFSKDAGGDEVVRIQLCAFKLTDRSDQ